MSVGPDPVLYPDIADSLSASVQAAFERAGRPWTVSDRETSPWWVSVYSARRCSTGRAYREQRAILVRLWTRDHSETLAAVLHEVGELAEPMDSWQSGASVAELTGRFPVFTPWPPPQVTAIADETERRWQLTLHDMGMPITMSHLWPLIDAAAGQPALRALYPIVLPYRFGFKQARETPGRSEFPFTEPVPGQPGRFLVRDADRRELGRGDVAAVIALVVAEVERIAELRP